MGGTRRVTARIAIATVFALLATIPAFAASASSPPVDDGGVIANAVPAKFTPNIGNGATEAIVQVGSRLVVGGTFTTVTPTAGPGAGTAVMRKSLIASKADTGALDTGS